MTPEWITSFRNHTLAFTGKVLVDGEWTVREDCVAMARVRGAADWKTDMSARVTLLVYGDLASANVTDKTRQYSKKLALAEKLRRGGRDVAVIDGAGFSDLCSGFPARNRELRPETADHYLVLPALGDGVLGGPLSIAPVPNHEGWTIEVDLVTLDKGTAAHQATLASFSRVLHARGLVPERPGRRAPQFDVGWVDRGRTFIGEVKSLGGGQEDQQIRLGLGQVVDYVSQLRSTSTSSQPMQPVLVLEREPAEPRRWIDATYSAGVLVTWGPDFSWQR